MPPKPKFTKEDIAAAAFDIIKKGGVSALTARELGKKLGTSSSPVFTVFANMEEVKLAARTLALQEFKGFISDFREYTPAFKRIGMMIVSYGLREPEMFKLLFMQEHREQRGFQGTLEDLGEVGEVCLELIQRDYQMTSAQARLLFEHMWTHAFGLGAMCATGVCRFTEEEIGARLGLVFMSLVSFIKSGNVEQVYADVERGDSYHGRRVGDLSGENGCQ